MLLSISHGLVIRGRMWRVVCVTVVLFACVPFRKRESRTLLHMLFARGTVPTRLLRVDVGWGWRKCEDEVKIEHLD